MKAPVDHDTAESVHPFFSDVLTFDFAQHLIGVVQTYATPAELLEFIEGLTWLAQHKCQPDWKIIQYYANTMVSEEEERRAGPRPTAKRSTEHLPLPVRILRNWLKKGDL